MTFFKNKKMMWFVLVIVLLLIFSNNPEPEKKEGTGGFISGLLIAGVFGFLIFTFGFSLPLLIILGIGLLLLGVNIPTAFQPAPQIPGIVWIVGFALLFIFIVRKKKS